MRTQTISASFATSLALIALTAACSSTGTEPRANVDGHALAQRVLILDGHVDVPYRLRSKMADVSERTDGGHFDYPRAVEGGLNAPFMSIYVPAATQLDGTAKVVGDELIDLVEGIVLESPDKFTIATTARQVREAFAMGRISFLLGMENGAPLLDDLANLDHFYLRGVRYITLCHSKDNLICDSSYDESADTHDGLSSYGRDVVRRMNDLGVLVDISHVSDEAFWDVMHVARVPAIASHSSLRHFTPGWERNMSDPMIARLARDGGVVQINFGSWFLTSEFQEVGRAREASFRTWSGEQGLITGTDAHAAAWKAWQDEHPLPIVDVADVADHIDHAVSIAGIDHVGLGSDFDGVGNLPVGLEDVSGYPNLLAELLRRGYTEQDIEKICSGNVLRVMEAAERLATRVLRPLPATSF
jgi:membrane dipeptidase